MFSAYRKSWEERKKVRRSRQRLELFRQNYFADVAVALEELPQFRGELFPPSGPACWIDRPDALLHLQEMLATGVIDESDEELCRRFIADGYYIVKGLIESDTLDSVWSAYEKALADGTLVVAPESHGEGDAYPGRVLDPHLAVPEIRELLWHRSLLRITDLLFGRKTVPFQTIMGHKGSQQGAHSDTIHMTTYPLGFLLAAWISFEDVHPDSGPLLYYPKSHKLVPCLLSADVGIGMMEFKEKGSEATYSARYEPAIQQYLLASDVSPEVFTAQKGDVLFWHANLIHGGSMRKDLTHSRKAMVCHYFAEGAFTYHDLSGNASRLHKNGVHADVVKDLPV